MWDDIAKGFYGLLRWKFESLLRVAPRVPEREQVVQRFPATLLGEGSDWDLDAMYYEYTPSLRDRHGVQVFRDRDPLCLDLDELARNTLDTVEPLEGQFYLLSWEEDYLIRCAERE